MSVTLATRNRGRVVELSYVFLDVCVWAKLSKLEDGGLERGAGCCCRAVAAWRALAGSLATRSRPLKGWCRHQRLVCVLEQPRLLSVT